MISITKETFEELDYLRRELELTGYNIKVLTAEIKRVEYELSKHVERVMDNSNSILFKCRCAYSVIHEHIPIQQFTNVYECTWNYACIHLLFIDHLFIAQLFIFFILTCLGSYSQSVFFILWTAVEVGQCWYRLTLLH